MNVEVAAIEAGFCEGPVWRPATGDLVVGSLSDGALMRVDLDTGRAERFADTAGGPNGGVLVDEGAVLVTQNGGVDVGGWWGRPTSPVRPVAPGLQMVGADGTVRTVATGQTFCAPNDIAIDTDGSAVFSDLVHDGKWTNITGRLWRLAPDGTVTLIEEVPHYLKSVSAAPGGLLAAEHSGLRWVRAGDRSSFSDCGHTEGFAADVDGRVYACLAREGLAVIDVDGTVVERVELPENHFATNCCFGGRDLRTLFITDAGNGSVLAIESMPAPGHPLTPFRPTADIQIAG